MSSSDSSSLDFSTPSKADQPTSDDYNWDSHEEELSFNNQPQSSPPHQEQAVHPFIFGEDFDEPTTVWPPRQLSSEDYSQLEADPVPLNFLAIVPEEEVSDEVFGESDTGSEDLTTVEMPPKTQPTPEELEVKFKRALRNWSQNHARFNVQGAKILQNDIDDMKERRDNLEEIADDIFDAVNDDKENELYVTTLASINKVRNELSSLYESFEKSRQPENANVNEVNPDQVIDRELKKMKTVMDHHITEFDKMLTKLSKLVIPSAENLPKAKKAVDDIVESSKENKKAAEEIYKKAVAEISCYSAPAKINEENKNFEKIWLNVNKKSDVIAQQVTEHLDKFPKPVSTTETEVKSSIPLERLPLPKFSGKKVDYNRFKQDFKKHVKYSSEDEKVLALKEKCLQKNADKEKIANCATLERCWQRLDAEYGNIETTVCDIFRGWRNLKPPQNDSQFVFFMDQIENGVACLESLDCKNELTSSSIINIEEKLNERMQLEISKLVTNKSDPEKKTQDIVLEYLALEKISAQRRLANKAPSNNVKKGKDDETVTSNTSSRGRGYSRGGARGGGNNSLRGSNNNSSRGRGQVTRGRTRGGKRVNNSPCLLCEEQHALSKCPKWFDEDTDKRFLLGFCFTNRICTQCLDLGHNFKNCPSEDAVTCPCGSTFNISICCVTDDCRLRKNWNETNNNNTILSNNQKIGSNSVMVNGAKLGQAILPIQNVKVFQSQFTVKMMFDNCSQNTFILDETAQKLKLDGVKISFTLICTDGSRTKKNGKLYDVKIVDNQSVVHQIQAIGLTHLSTAYSGFKVVNIRRKISNISKCQDLKESMLKRESGAIDILLGSDIASLHPEKVTSIGELVLLKSKFGWTVMGHSQSHVIFTSKLDGTRANVCGVEELHYETVANIVSTKDIQFLEAISTESLGVNAVTKCKSCKIKSDNCRECKLISTTTNYLEYLQDLQIEEGIEKIPNEPGYIASYPYTKEVELLLPNKEVCLKRAETVEQNISKKPSDMKQLNEVIQTGFENGTFRWLSEKEMKEWTGLVHYIPMNVVYKESESTPCRCIFDSGQPDKNGRSLNSCMGKGSNPINHFGSVILNFRAAENVASGDLKKMFNQIEVRDVDVHLRRFFMRPDGYGGKEPWRVAVPTCVNFGETAAPAVATKVKNRTADDFKHISEPVAQMIKTKCIMDDINIDCKYNEDIDDNIKKAEKILANGKFSFKKWIKSGDKGEKTFESDTVTKSLGLSWKTEKDLLCYRIKLNFSKKKRNRYVEPDTTLDTLEADFPQDLCKRISLKLNHSLFDPANLIQPWLLKMRLAYRDILFFEKENDYSDWDKALPEKFRKQWLQLTAEMFGLESLEFPRSIVPRDYNSDVKPALVLFSDGSDLGQCAVAYLVWTMLDGTNHVSLVTSRTKIASLTKISTPRSELCAAQLQSRLGSWLKNELDLEIGEIYHLVDASIVLGMLKNVSLKFDTFTAPRVTEIQNNTSTEQWFWVETRDNPADIGTRGKCSIDDLGPGTMWREGPDWLKDPRNQWPLRSDFRKNHIPGLKKEFEVLPTINNLTQLVEIHSKIDVTNSEENSTVIHNTNVSVQDQSKTVPDISSIVDYKKYKCWYQLLRVSASVLKAFYKFKKMVVPHQVDLIKEARNSWLIAMMDETRKMLKHRKLSGFIVHEKEGIIYATVRNKQENLNPEDLIILSPDHPVTRMILRSFHEVDHRGINHSVARSRIFFWIPQATKLMRSIKNNCFTCRINDATAMKQLMSPLPQLRLKPSPVWHYSMLDLFGPIEVQNFVNQRTSRKTWAVIITCLTTRACWVYLAESYSTDHLLSVLKKHEARNGSPQQYFADLGKQIIGADRILSEAITNIDQNVVENFASGRNVKFTFGTPYFHEGQGAVERLVQEVKKSLKIITKHQTITFGELDCMLSEASYLVNSRPLLLNPGLGDDGFICPNDVMFGRSDMTPPNIDVPENSLTRRAAHKQKIIAEFWDKWSGSYYQSLVRYHKWQLKTRNAVVGDVVLILDKETSKGKFCLGIIDSVKVDNDGQVRKVIVKYKTRPKSDNLSSVFKYTERNVRGLALLVKAEERDELVKDFDLVRTQESIEDSEDNDGDTLDETLHVAQDANEEPTHEENDQIDSETLDPVEDVNENPVTRSDTSDPKDTRTLPPTSTGRKRWKPKKYT